MTLFVLGILTAACGFLLALLLLCGVAEWYAKRLDREWSGWPGEPEDGRFCARPGCGGFLSYRRTREHIGGKVVFLTYLQCWRCGAHRAIHTEPDYGEDARVGKANEDGRNTHGHHDQ